MELQEIEKMAELEAEHWWFSAKRRLIVDYVSKIRKGLLLDIGCGTGENTKEFKKYHDVVSCDISRETIKFSKDKTKGKFVLADVEYLPFKDNTFGLVVALDILEHINDDVKTIKQIHSLLKSNAKFIINVPAHMFLFNGHDILLHHKRRYVQSELKSKVINCGFNINKLTYWNFLLFPLTIFFKIISNNSNINETNGWVNKVLYKILCIDNFLIKNISLPFGVSLFCVAQK